MRKNKCECGRRDPNVRGYFTIMGSKVKHYLVLDVRHSKLFTDVDTLGGNVGLDLVGSRVLQRNLGSGQLGEKSVRIRW